MAAIAYGKRERSVCARKCADFESIGVSHVVNNPDISGRVVGVDPKADDSARIVDAERRDKETSGRCCLRDHCRAAAAVDYSLLSASGIDRADDYVRRVYVVRVAECFPAGEGKLRDHAALPNHRQPARAE
ncbi:MAG: hypothetical protein DMF06_00650 [Verrucomicrobia bacterium]|nr:MAG: hypothetical protein DMF06_00650 [Verrucomicrobiota bacterium]